MRRKTGHATRDSRLAVLAVILAALLFPSCSSKSVPRNQDPFPRTGEVAGWMKSSETRTFPASDLWKYIDGDAERYIQAGVATTRTSDFRFQNKIDAVADIHLMNSPDGPKKMLEAEWSSEGQRLDLGEDARLYATSLVFRKDRYLVRIIAYQDAPEVGPALLALGQAIEKKLGAVS